MSELYIVEMEQGSPEWHALRQSKRPASITPMLMGTSKFQDEGDAYDAMMGDREAPGKHVERILDYGNRTEPRARAKLAEIVGAQGFPVVGYRGDYLASIDFFVNTDGKAIYEVKCPFSGAKSQTWKAAVKGEIEPGYADQIEHQCNVFEPARAFLFVYLDDDTWKLLEYTRRPGRWKEIEKEWDRFVRVHLDKFERPNPFVKRDDTEWGVAAGAFALAKAELEDAEGKVEAAKALLTKLAGGRKTEGAGVRVNIFPKRGAVDYKAALEFVDPNFDAEPFRKPPTTSTTITLVTEKEKP